MAYACRMVLRLIEVLVAAALLLLSTSSPLPALSFTSCEGDCGEDDQVTVDELVRGVKIALGTLELGNCAALDVDDGVVSVDELITAVARSMGGCPPHVEAVECWFTLPPLEFL